MMRITSWPAGCLFFLLTCCFWFGGGGPVLATEVFFTGKGATNLDNAIRLPALAQSCTIFGRLAYPGQYDYYTFSGRKGEVFTVEMAVPTLGNPEKFRLFLAIAGPGLPVGDHDSSLFVLPPGVGLYTVKPVGKEREKTDSPYGTDYRVTQVFQLVVPGDADYYVIAYNPEGLTGKYVLRVGPPAEAGILTAVCHPGRFLAVRAWYNPVQLLVVMALLSMAGGVLLLSRRAKR
ncbi:MAG: hypothetical protein PHU78_02165 [Heliobacteriaceae bacterium]|nr:hypothetical protein [Heliobacteriaceae bacterium]